MCCSYMQSLSVDSVLFVCVASVSFVRVAYVLFMCVQLRGVGD